MPAIPLFHGGLRRHLVLLVLVALLPMLMFAGGLAWWNSLQQRAAIERGLAETARALTIAVDQEVELSIEGLASAGLSPALRGGNYRIFDKLLREQVVRHSGWLFANLFDSSGRQIVNTLRPFGETLPTIAEYGGDEFAQAFRRVIETGQPAVSNLFIGKLSSRPQVVVVVPAVGRDGAVHHVLAAALLPERLVELLRRQKGPEGWVASITDRHHVVVARSIAHDRFVGRLSPKWWRQEVDGRKEGIATGLSLQGPVLTFAFHRSPLTGWLVVFGAPREVFTSNLNQSLAVTAGFGLLLVAGSVLVALGVARRILAPVGALTGAARPFIRDHMLPRGRRYPVTELDELHRALDGLASDLARTRQRIEKVFSVAPAMLFVCDEDNRLTEVNDAWLRVLGYRRDEVMGKPLFDFLTEESRIQAMGVMWPHYLQTGVVDDIPAQYRAKSGEVRDVLVSLRGEYDEAGKLARTIGAVRDVTEQRRADAALNRAVDEAAKANAAKTRFLAAASHDLRQPLQALSLYIGVLKGRLADSECDRDKPVMGAIGQCVDTLSGLLNDMLDVARLDAGAIVPKMAEVPVARLLEPVAAAWTIQAEAKGLRIDFHPCDRAVRTDAALMDRVLTNLVGNAVRYTERGRILVGCRRVGGDRVRIEVWDTGIGIPEDKLGDIFEEFRQLGNPERRRDRGTGLGLAIVHRICGLLGHRLDVRSWPGRGSMFAVTLAAAEGRDLPEGPADEPESVERHRILVVDDEVHVRTALGMVLRELGHEVVTAETIDEALDCVDKSRPQLVIADFRLGGGHTGVEVVDAVRRRMRDDVPAVVLTGDTDPATIRSIVDAGLHLLNKPLQVEALKTFLRQVA